MRRRPGGGSLASELERNPQAGPHPHPDSFFGRRPVLGAFRSLDRRFVEHLLPARLDDRGVDDPSILVDEHRHDDDALDLLQVSMEQGNALYRSIVKKMLPVYGNGTTPDELAA